MGNGRYGSANESTVGNDRDELIELILWEWIWIRRYVRCNANGRIWRIFIIRI